MLRPERYKAQSNKADRVRLGSSAVASALRVEGDEQGTDLLKPPISPA